MDGLPPEFLTQRREAAKTQRRNSFSSGAFWHCHRNAAFMRQAGECNVLPDEPGLP
jgi:hypothetical protein